MTKQYPCIDNSNDFTSEIKSFVVAYQVCGVVSRKSVGCLVFTLTRISTSKPIADEGKTLAAFIASVCLCHQRILYDTDYRAKLGSRQAHHHALCSGVQSMVLRLWPVGPIWDERRQIGDERRLMGLMGLGSVFIKFMKSTV